MSRILIPSLLTLLCVGACSTAPEGPPTSKAAKDAAAASTAAAGDSTARAADGDYQDPAAQGPEPGSDLQETMAEIFNEPQFAREMAKSYLRGAEVEPPLTLRQDELRREVLELIRDQQMDKAASRLRSRQGDTPVFDFMLGNVYMSQEKFAEAVAEYSKATGDYPKFLRAWRQLGVAQMRVNDFAGAARSFVEVIKLGGVDAQTYGFLATMYAQAGDFVAAEQAFRTVTMLEPDRERWRIMLAKSLFGQSRYAEGAALIRGLLAKDPAKPKLWLLQAEAYANMQQPKKAAESLEIADGLGGSSFASLAMLGNIYFNDGLFDLAVDAYLRAMEREDKGSYELPLQIANRLAFASAYGESARLVQGIEQAYGDTIDKDAKTSMLKLRARLAVATGASEEQVEILQKIVDDNPLDGDALIQLARHYQGAGDTEKAILRYEQAAQNQEFAAEAKSLHAQLLVNDGKFAAALPLLKEAQQLEPREAVQQLLDYVERAASRTKSGS